MNNPYERLDREELEKLSTDDLIATAMEKQDELRELYAQIIEKQPYNCHSHTMSIHENSHLIDICIDNIARAVSRNKEKLSAEDHTIIVTALDCIVGALLCIDSHLEDVEDKKSEPENDISQKCRYCKFSGFSVYHEPCSTCKMHHTHFVPQETDNEKLKVREIDPSTVKCTECKHKVDNVCTVRWNGEAECVDYDKFEPRKD